LKRLLQGLQAELDSCWAVIGEVYGRFGPLANLGLVIRRIRTNLDDEKAFAATVPYIPCNAKFDAAGADLLKLLIQPLYGDEPEIGIRELLQNALDACLELKDVLDRDPTTPHPDLPDQEADVVITLEDSSNGDRNLSVSDRGIGMTPSVVLEYFLKAGASFRRSDAWRQQHESESGESRVLRSGRFGIGALAAFLLGEEIEVSTRHVGVPPEGGVSFTASLNSEEIQLNHCTRPVGTTIRVRISNETVWDALIQAHWEDRNLNPDPLRTWDYYCVSGLSVQRVLLNKGVRTVLPQRLTFPAAGSELLPPWHRLLVPGYLDVQWAYESSAERLICNGILVADKRDYEIREWIAQEGFRLIRPTVSVFDPDGRLPLNLQRTGLAVSQLPFTDQLWDSLCEDFVAWVLANAPTAPPVARGDTHPRYPPFIYEKPRTTFGYTAEGAILLESWALKKISPSKVIFFPSAAGIQVEPGPNDLLIPLDLKGAGIDARKTWFRCLMGWNWRAGLRPFELFKAAGLRTILSTAFYQDLKRPRSVAGFLWDRIKVEPSNNRWTILSSGACNDGRIDFAALLDSSGTADIEGLTEYFGVVRGEPLYDPESNLPTRFHNRWPLSAVWERSASEVVIPYNLNLRTERFRSAYATLLPTIEYYEKLKREKKAGGPRVVLTPAQ
jgi:hypothetical protein